MNEIEITIDGILFVCSLILYIITIALIANGEYIISIAAGIMNISGIQLYRWVEDHDNNE